MPRQNGDRLLIGVIVLLFGLWAFFGLIRSGPWDCAVHWAHGDAVCVP